MREDLLSLTARPSSGMRPLYVALGLSLYGQSFSSLRFTLLIRLTVANLCIRRVHSLIRSRFGDEPGTNPKPAE